MSPKLSVCFITYNQEKYVRQALESVMMQQCDFNFEVVIGNDCSTDGTGKIIEEFISKYPDKIRLNLFEKNVGMTANWLSTINACNGEYVAMLEGDDYWLDTNKLQKQVELLDKNPSYSFSAHDLSVVKESGTTAEDALLHFTEDNVFTIYDCLEKQIFLQTSSMVFRRAMLPAFPKWVDKRVKCIDYLVFLMLTMRSPLHYIADKMSVYRMHEAGVSNIFWRKKKNALQFDMIFVLKNFNKFSQSKFKKHIDDKLEKHYLQLLGTTMPNSKIYLKALAGIIFLRPTKHVDLLKGYIINNFVPVKIYNLYQKLF